MRSVVSAKIKLPTIPEVVDTIEVYTKGLQYCIDTAWKMRIKNNIKLHPFVYIHLRETLPAQLSIACIKQACGMVKKAKSKPFINRTSIRYNFPRSASFKNNVLSISTIKGRVKIPFSIPSCYTEYFNWQVNESLLRIDYKGRCFFIFTFSKEVNVANDTSQFVLGIDLGVNTLAVTSNNKFYGSSKVKQAKRKFKFLREKLQAKGTQSSKKLLKKISGRENRYMSWINHNISKNIVTTFQGGKIVMEDLKGIRKKHRGKRMNYWISNWSFYQLQFFIQYKAERQGIEVVKVNPMYTSQICHKCGQLGSRSKGCFCCNHCGLNNFNADLNAGRNLAHPMLVERQANVTLPNIQSDEIKGILTDATAIELMNKSHAL